jgi:RNA polymerase I-specific transcription initiation factor RRN3
MDGHGVHVEVPTNIKHIQDMVNKLDAILTLLFEHFQRTYESVSASNSSRPLSPLELLPLPPLSSSTLSLSNPHTASFVPSSTPLTPTPPTVVSIPNPLPQSQQTSSTPVPHTEQYLRVQFQGLLSIFDRIILRTFKSRYTQFLIFWYTSLDPQFADIFQGMLVDRALLGGGADPQLYGGSTTTEDGDKYMATPELTRAAAASYIGSFVSRATFVDREGARRVVGVLCEFLNAHLESVEQALRAGWATPGVDGAFPLTTQGQHTVFYAVTQAVFLIFCFRWRDLVDEEDMGDDDDQLRLYLDSNGMIAGRTRKPISTNKGKWMPELDILKRVVVSVLNPLKVNIFIFSIPL